MKMKLDHVHLTVNAIISPDFKGLGKERSQQLVDKLMKETGMKPLGPLLWSGAEDLDFPGQSFVQMITTSHISMHFFSETNEIYFDLYSCKSFDEKKVTKILDEEFGLKTWHGMKYTRQTNGTPNFEILGNVTEKEFLVAKATN